MGDYLPLPCGVNPAGSWPKLPSPNKKPPHVLLDQLQGFRIGGAQAVFVHDGGQALQPLLPTLLGNMLINPLSKFARMRRAVQAFGFLLQYDTKYGTRHNVIYQDMIC